MLIEQRGDLKQGPGTLDYLEEIVCSGPLPDFYLDCPFVVEL